MQFVEEYQKHNEYQDDVLLLAPTGIAAEHLNNEYSEGQTIDSFLWASKKHSESFLDFVASYSVIVIDEISMVHDYKMQKILELINEVAQLKHKEIRLILVGDPFQLPPVVTPDTRKIRRKETGNPDITFADFYFFKSTLFQELFENNHFYYIHLSGSYRQANNTSFLQLLDKIASWSATQEDLSILSSRVVDSQEILKISSDVPILVTRREDAKSLNHLLISEYLYPFASTYIYAKVEMSDNSVDRKTIQELLDDEQIYNTIEFAMGMPVLFVKNDRNKRWRNGTRGKIVKIGIDSFDEYEFTIQKQDGDMVTVKKISVPIIALDFDTETHKIVKTKVAQVTQYPFICGYAFTIHKAQGLTFDEIIIGQGFGFFAPGQLYSALSRVRDLDNLHLLAPVQVSDIKPNDAVNEYWQ